MPGAVDGEGHGFHALVDRHDDATDACLEASRGHCDFAEISQGHVYGGFAQNERADHPWEKEMDPCPGSLPRRLVEIYLRSSEGVAGDNAGVEDFAVDRDEGVGRLPRRQLQT